MITLKDLSFEAFDPERQVGPCIWPHFDFLYVYDGLLRMRVGASSLRLEPRHALVIYPQTSYAGRSDTLTKAAAIHFMVDEAKDGTTTVPAVFERLAGKQAGFEVHDCRHSPAMEQDIERLVGLSRAPLSPALHDMRMALLTLILGQIYPGFPTLQSTMPQSNVDSGGEFQALIWWLHNNLHRSITLDEMAQFVELSPSHFRARFRRAASESPGNFLLSLRLQKARQLLVETDEPIKAIGQAVGYSDLPHFYRVFKQKSGLTPHQWRAQHTRSGEGKWRKRLP